MIFSALLLGLLGSLHCLGMCGPLAAFAASHLEASSRSRIFYAVQYHAGRIAVYMILGALFGAFGQLIGLSKIQNPLAIIFGIVLILLSCLSLNVEQIFMSTQPMQKFYATILQFLNKHMRGAMTRPLAAGAMNGILPCGMVYLALVSATVAKSVSYGALFMLGFGVGTLPVFAMILLGQHLKLNQKRKWFRQVYPIAQMAIGIFLIYRGFQIQIPTDWMFWAGLSDPTMCHQ